MQVRASRGSSSRLAVIGRADGRGSLGFLAVESEERVALADAIKAGYIVRREKNEGQYAYTHDYILCFRISSFLREAHKVFQIKTRNENIFEGSLFGRKKYYISCTWNRAT